MANHSLEAVVVCKQFFQYYMQAARNRFVLHWMGMKRQNTNLPSWVPDLSITRPVGVLERRGGWKMDFPLRLLDNFAFEGSAFRIKGRGLDRIAIIGQEMIASKSFFTGQPAFTAILRNWETIAQSRPKLEKSHRMG